MQRMTATISEEKNSVLAVIEYEKMEKDRLGLQLSALSDWD